MTLKTRRILLDILLVLALMMTALTAYAWTLWFSGGFAAIDELPFLTESWWSQWRPAVQVDIIWALAGLSFFCLFPLIGEAAMRRSFGRSPSPEIFFIRIFLLSLPLQAARVSILFVLSGIIDASWGLTAVRFAWFGRFLSIIALLNVGLYGQEIPFRRSGAVMVVGGLAAMAVAVMLPLDVSQPLGNLMVRIGASTALLLTCLSIEFLSVFSLIGSALSQRNPRYYLLAFALLLIVGGWDIAFFASSPLLIPGCAMMLGGVIAFSREIRKIYQWV